MTIQRSYGNDTNFGKWLRTNDQLDSSNGYVATDVDYVWNDYKSNRFMLIEEKCNKATSSFPQSQTFKMLDEAIKGKESYHGFHLLQFDNTSPTDGKIYLDGRQITEGQLVKFFQFELPEKYYDTYEVYLNVS